MEIESQAFEGRNGTAAMAEVIRDSFADRGCEVDAWDVTELGARSAHPVLDLAGFFPKKMEMDGETPESLHGKRRVIYSLIRSEERT